MLMYIHACVHLSKVHTCPTLLLKELMWGTLLHQFTSYWVNYLRGENVLGAVSFLACFAPALWELYLLLY